MVILSYRFEYSDFHCRTVRGFVFGYMLQIVWDNCREDKCLTNVLTTGHKRGGFGHLHYLIRF